MHKGQGSRATQDAHSPRYAGGNVLLVDDNIASIRMLSTLLSVTGLKVLETLNGEDALAFAAIERFDLVFMDVSMPGMDGIEACRRIRTTSIFNRTARIIAATAHADLESAGAFRALGFDDILPKPVDSRMLYQLTDKYLAHRVMPQAG